MIIVDRGEDQRPVQIQDDKHRRAVAVPDRDQSAGTFSDGHSDRRSFDRTHTGRRGSSRTRYHFKYTQL